MTAVGSRRRRSLAGDVALAGGLVGPAVFIADWAALGATRSGYSPVDDAISRLAELHSGTRPAMTAGFIVYGAGLAAFGWGMRRRFSGRAWVTAGATGLLTFGVAAFPLGAVTSGRIHAIFAGAGYVTLALTPLIAAPTLRRLGHLAAARLSVAVGLASGVCLAATTVGPAHGLLQRIGLTLGDAWIMTAAACLLRPVPAAAVAAASTGSRRRWARAGAP